MPDTTGLDLKEQERYWAYVKAGRAHDYHGIAVHPRHLSWWYVYTPFLGCLHAWSADLSYNREHVVLKRSQYYDPEADKEAKIEELKTLYFKLHGSDFAEKTLAEHIIDEDDMSVISAEVKAYFDRRTPVNSPRNMPMDRDKASSQ